MNFNFPQRPNASYFGRYPRSLSEAFPGDANYGAAIEIPSKGKNALRGFLRGFKRILFIACAILAVSVLVNSV